MALFGLKKNREVKEAREIIEELEEEEKVADMSAAKECLPMPAVASMPATEGLGPDQKASPDFAPLFIRIDKYKNILQTMNYLRNTVGAVKSSLNMLKDLDTLRQENLRIVEDAMGKVEEKLSSLDSNFMRPSGFSEEVLELRHFENVEITLDDLKSQISQLKSQIEGFA